MTMKKAIFKIDNIKYQYDENRKGTKWSLDGEKWMNGGEFKEIAYKACLGYKAEKDANTRFDKGSDIEERAESVKSSKATLTSAKLGESLEEIIKAYFERVASDKFTWVTIFGNELKAYTMNANEFKKFIEEWARYDKSRKVVRFKVTSKKMVRWLEERAA